MSEFHNRRTMLPLEISCMTETTGNKENLLFYEGKENTNHCTSQILVTVHHKYYSLYITNTIHTVHHTAIPKGKINSV